MNAKFTRAWIVTFLAAGGFAAWISFGETYVRRTLFGVPPIAEASRTESQFVAVVLPKISDQVGSSGMPSEDLADFLSSLKAAGYVSIGLDDVAQLYSRHRLLPPRSILLAFAQDDPQGVAAADKVLKRLRLRGTLFITAIAVPGMEDQRQFLTRHAIGRLRQSGAWNIGRLRGQSLESDGFPLRFLPGDVGLDDQGDPPRFLRILSIHADRDARENVRIVINSWPRTADLADDFGTEASWADWIAGWGVVSIGNRRMTLLPTPRQSSAAVFLRGTEKWRDQTLEFSLKRYQREFWAYARYRESGGFIRFGARNGYWCVEQKVRPNEPTRLLARAPIRPGTFPAAARFVLKGDSAIVHVNGRMQFGRILRVDSSVDQGRVLFAVYDKGSSSALAVLSSVHACPLKEEWISFKRGPSSGFDENALEDVRDEAVRARVFSPLWVRIANNGLVTIAQSQETLVRSLAGFYGCKIVPMADFSGLGSSVLSDRAKAARLADDLANAAGNLDAAGLNLRLNGQIRRRGTVSFLSRLRAAFHARRRRLWVTIDPMDPLGPALRTSVDGLLVPSEKRPRTFTLLEAINP